MFLSKSFNNCIMFLILLLFMILPYKCFIVILLGFFPHWETGTLCCVFLGWPACIQHACLPVKFTLFCCLLNFIIRLGSFQVPNSSPRWIEFLSHWPLWSIYIAHFSMNWSNYIIMQWLPTYMARNLGAEKQDIMFTAIPYLMNSLVGVG